MAKYRPMPTLQERLEEVMAAKGWQHSDLVRVSRQTSSVVSQWLGKGSKEIKTIGKLEAAIYLAHATGFSALWIAKGMEPKFAPTHCSSDAHSAQEGSPPPYAAAELLERMGLLLSQVAPAKRKAVGDVLRGWAEEGGADHWRQMLLTLLSPNR